MFGLSGYRFMVNLGTNKITYYRYQSATFFVWIPIPWDMFLVIYLISAILDVVVIKIDIL